MAPRPPLAKSSQGHPRIIKERTGLPTDRRSSSTSRSIPMYPITPPRAREGSVAALARKASAGLDYTGLAQETGGTSESG